FFMDYDHRSPGYGPSLVPTEASADLRSRFPKTVGVHTRPIKFVAKKFGSKGVVDLEKLATALWVTRELGPNADDRQRAQRLHESKQHVSMTDAIKAVQEFDQIAAEAKTLG